VACPFCDTAVLHRYSKRERASLIDELRFMQSGHPHHGLILTGGEPLLQLDAELMCAVSDIFPWVDVETNGTVALKTARYDNVFISCSPKLPVIKVKADWYKVLIPDKEHLLKEVLELAQQTNAIVYVQPVEIGGYASAITQENMRKCIEICNRFGTVRLSIQAHKIVGVR
jgi:7-carboxy-7-deazaguanine synthase